MTSRRLGWGCAARRTRVHLGDDDDDDETAPGAPAGRRVVLTGATSGLGEAAAPHDVRALWHFCREATDGSTEEEL